MTTDPKHPRPELGRASPLVRPDIEATDVRVGPVDQAELDHLTADISARLQAVCAHLPRGEFAALVLDIAHVRLRYRVRYREIGLGHPPSSKSEG